MVRAATTALSAVDAARSFVVQSHSDLARRNARITELQATGVTLLDAALTADDELDSRNHAKPKGLVD